MADGTLEWDGSEVVLSQCVRCSRKHKTQPTCEAFPEGIPVVILTNQHDHRTLYDGDGGLMFQPK